MMSIHSLMSRPPYITYANTLFKNRLEAQWAVFFDKLGVHWEYPGLMLPGHNHYLPDFWLPKQQCWIDIRAERPTEDDILKAADLAFEVHRWVAIVWGDIGKHQIIAFYAPFYEQGYYDNYRFSVCQHCKSLILVCPLRGGEPNKLIGYCHECQGIILQTADAPDWNLRLLAAYNAASTVHFHNESAARPAMHFQR